MVGIYICCLIYCYNIHNIYIYVYDSCLHIYACSRFFNMTISQVYLSGAHHFLPPSRCAALVLIFAQGGHAFRKRAGARVRDQGWHVGVGRNPLTGWLPLLPFRLIIAGKTSQDQGSLLAKISFLYLHYIVNGYMIYIYNYIIIPPWFCIILPRDLYFAKISFLYLGCWELDGQVAETSK